MKATEKSRIGRTDLFVTKLGLGGAPFGGLHEDVQRTKALESILSALDLGIGYLDTAPLYGGGKSESFFGEALKGIERTDYVISTKVGRIIESDFSHNSDESLNSFVNIPNVQSIYDYSRDGILKSLEDSLKRLNLEYVDMALIHDADNHMYQALNETIPVLEELRSEGVVKAIGCGMNHVDPLIQFARHGDFDVFLLAGRYTLLDQSGFEVLMPLCLEKEISIVLGGPYNSGLLASDLSDPYVRTKYFYEDTPPEVLSKARLIKDVCDRYSVPLKAAALQFGFGHPSVASTIPGARTLEEVTENFKMAEVIIPPELWIELVDQKLMPKNIPFPV